jgi:hypothetical protein
LIELFGTLALLDALLEVPERFGVGDVAATAQAQEAFKAGAVEDLLLGGVVTQPVELFAARASGTCSRGRREACRLFSNRV